MKRVLTLSVAMIAFGAAFGAVSLAQAEDKAGVNCREISDNAARLACYDAQASGAVSETDISDKKAQAKTPPATPAAASLPSGAPLSPAVKGPLSETEERFGITRSRDVEKTAEEFGSLSLRKRQRAERRDERMANKEGRKAAKTARKTERQAEKQAKRAATLESIETKLVKFKKLPDGRVRLTLANGQIWEQVDVTQKVRIRPGPSPAVTIQRATMGSFRMKITDVPGLLRVKRIK